MALPSGKIPAATRTGTGHTWVELDRGALLSNVRTFRELCPRSAFMAVVKSNAYGHGLREVAMTLSGHADWFGVNSVAEAAAVRAVDERTPILVMGRFASGELPALRELPSTTVVVSSADDIRELSAGAPGTPFHLKIDTGMGRLGTHGQELRDVLLFLSENARLPWTGVMTHFANVEDVTDQDFARKQVERFTAASDAALQSARERKLVRHAAASASALLLDEGRLDIVRVGISLYGLWPSRETRISARSLYTQTPLLRPVMRWLTRVAHINHVPRDETVGYGCTFHADRDLRIAVLPVGYYEGYDRKLSNRSYVMINNRRARVLGRVCMNMIMVDVTDHEGVEIGSTAVLIGSDESGEPTADQLAEQAGTINYEITTRVHADFPRKIV